MKTSIILGLMLVCSLTFAQNRPVNPEAKQFRYSKTIEKERPELNEETKALISAYRRDPSASNYRALRIQVEKNYDKVIARKKEKLEELRQTARDYSKVEEMEAIVQGVIDDREHRIEQTMARFTDPRMGPGARTPRNGFLPLIGAGETVWVAYAPVTNREYARFDSSYTYDSGKDNYPAVNVSYEDALMYCAWLSSMGRDIYRLPTEDEWEFAAGHMPKDADFNCGIGWGLTPVDEYANTKGACGGIDFWGNCWEWTSTVRLATEGPCSGQRVNAIKGGSWDSPRMSCRTEYRAEGRNPSARYPNVGFRVVRDTSGK